MNKLYPPLSPYSESRLAVGEGHEIFIEVCGNPRGLPVLFLHGGPGSGCAVSHRCYFDPAAYRIVLLDQRGCGRSSPTGGIRGNSTGLLVQDLDRIRDLLGIRRWVLFGGSWGATLALAYARANPEAVSGMVLRGVFLGREQDLDWFFGERGVARLFPDAAEEFRGRIPVEERGDPIGAYHRRVHGGDPGIALEWARAWTDWADLVTTWNIRPENAGGGGGPKDVQRFLGKVRIETHYAVNRYFLADTPLLEAARRRVDVPLFIVHGRRDLTCLLDASWSLHKAVPGSRLTVLPDTGHLAGEPAMVDALVSETDRMRDLLT